MQLDEIDIRILRHLQRDARMSNVDWPAWSACRRRRACVA